MSEFPLSGLILGGVFLVFVAATVGGALLAALTTRIIRSVCGLALSCIGLAGLYYYLQSPFLALMEILIYVGAVCVTIIFAVMLAEPDEPAPREKGERSLLWGAGGLFAAAAVFALIARLSLTGPWPGAPATAGDGSVQAVGGALLTTFSLAFEVISVVLLIAIVGALAIARSGRRGHP